MLDCACREDYVLSMPATRHALLVYVCVACAIFGRVVEFLVQLVGLPKAQRSLQADEEVFMLFVDLNIGRGVGTAVDGETKLVDRGSFYEGLFVYWVILFFKYFLGMCDRKRLGEGRGKFDDRGV